MIRIGWGEIVSLMWALGVKDRDHMESRLVSPMTEAEKRGFPTLQKGYRIALAVLVVTAVAGVVITFLTSGMTAGFIALGVMVAWPFLAVTLMWVFINIAAYLNEHDGRSHG